MAEARNHSDDAAAIAVLFTRAFPFGDGEPFIEAELESLSRSFDRVVIVPVAVSPSERTSRTVPENTIVLHLSKRRPMQDPLRFALLHPFETAVQLIASARVSGRPADKVTELKFRIQTQARSIEATRELGPLLSISAVTVFYSYWLHLPASIAAQVRSALDLPNTPIVSRAHRFDIYGEGASGFLPQRREVLSEVDRIFAVSDAGAAYLRERWPDYSAKFLVARLGTPAATNPVRPGRELRLVRSCSRIVPFKRLPLLIRGLAILQARGLRVSWEHIGKVEGEYAQSVRRFADAQLEPGTYTFLGGMSNAKVREWHATHRATVFVNVSESEGVPVSVLEALAVGLPIITTDVGGSSETIDPDAGMFDGLLPADPSEQQVADRLQELLASDDGAYASYVTSSTSHWSREWSSTTNFDHFSSMLRATAESGRADPDGTSERGVEGQTGR